MNSVGTPDFNYWF